MENLPESGMENGNVTLGHLGNLAPPGEREESASHHVLESWKHIFQHCASARAFAFKTAHLEYGDGVYIEISVISENHPGSFVVHRGIFWVLSEGPQ